MDRPLQLERRGTARLYEPDATPAEPVATPLIASDVEHRLIGILDDPRAPSEMLSDCFKRKEHAIGEVFASLTPAEALAMHRRLTTGPATDPLAARFGRLVVERRERLVGFLAQVRRRGAARRG